jgi:hypothetical protein
MSHTRGICLHHADHGVHTLRWNAQPGAHAAHRGVGTGDEGIGALRDQEECGEGSNQYFRKYVRGMYDRDIQVDIINTYIYNIMRIGYNRITCNRNI